MLVIIGGRTSSCVRGLRAVTKETPDLDKVDGVVYCDCSSKEAVSSLIEVEPEGGSTYILEHAYFALDCRAPTLKSLIALFEWIAGAQKFCNVFVLTREVSMIDKRVRSLAGLKFDFSV